MREEIYGPSGLKWCELVKVETGWDEPIETQMRANAQLIAAAPEMLESMKALVAIVSYAVNADILPFAEQSYAVKLNARRIIAKAEGDV